MEYFYYQNRPFQVIIVRQHIFVDIAKNGACLIGEETTKLTLQRHRCNCHKISGNKRPNVPMLRTILFRLIWIFIKDC